MFALSGSIQNTGLVEVPIGIPLREIIYEIGGGALPGHRIKAVQMGGPSGGCIPENKMDVAVDYSSLQGLGAMMGSGGMVVMDERSCMVDVAKFFMEFLRNESCGKCSPCREGTTRMYRNPEQPLRAARGRRNSAPGAVPGHASPGGARRDGSGNLALRPGPDRGQPGPEHAPFLPRRIRGPHPGEPLSGRRLSRASSITGSTPTFAWAARPASKKCPSGAIVGERKKAHYIVKDQCLGCGACSDTCPQNAIFEVR